MFSFVIALITILLIYKKIILDNVDTAKHYYLEVDYKNVCSVIMPKDAPLTNKKSIEAEDPIDKPSIFSRQALYYSEFQNFFVVVLKNSTLSQHVLFYSTIS